MVKQVFQNYVEQIQKEDFSKEQIPITFKFAEERYRSTRTSYLLSMYYAPFDFINKQAKLVICGITPGISQSLLAFREAQKQLRLGASVSEALMRAKTAASFGGRMQPLLVDMLDNLGINLKLKLESCYELFGSASSLVHFTSAVRYPVFIKGNNYRGIPSILVPPLRNIVETYLIEETKELPDAYYLALGDVPLEALEHLASINALKEEQILGAIPHPSGENGERIAIFLGRKEPSKASSKTNPEKITKTRSSILTKLKKAKF